MATYTELFDLRHNEVLRNRVTVACMVAAEKVMAEDPPVAIRRKWAVAAFENPEAWGQRALRFLLAQNRELTTAQLTGATDAAIQTAVDATVNLFAEQL